MIAKGDIPGVPQILFSRRRDRVARKGKRRMLVTIDIVGEQEEGIFQLVIRDRYVEKYGDKISGDEMGRFVRKWLETKMDGEILSFLRMVLTPLERYFEKIDREDVADLLDQVHYIVENFR